MAYYISMSGSADFDLREQLVRIDRMLAETHKFQEETNKFAAEQRKLIAEAAKRNRERWWSPVLAITALIGGLLGLASFIAKVMQ
ncbi:MAG: hypothetical protein JO212_20340 [Acetobacteraceae bacterium]|nr:hypothetical protein [Acetobacteraceae bacterium]